MNTVRQRRSGALALAHPAVLNRRLGDIALTGLTALLPTALGLAVVVGFPRASLPIALGIIVGALGIVALVVCSRLEVTVTLVLIYLLMLDGPIKMLTSQREETRTFGDLLILAVCVGAVLRITVQRKRIVLPPLSGWVIAWVVLVVVNAFNPQTHGFLAALGGFSQELQYVPFFFFGFLLMRSKRRFRQLFIIVGVAATASGIVAAYQTTLTPTQLASWGPGYQNLIHPAKGAGRIYFSEGEARVRPPGLGSEAGSSGGIGHAALPMCLALVAISRGRKKWIALALALGAMMAVVVGLGRLQLIGAALGVIGFAALAALTGRHLTRTVGAMLAIVVLAIPVGALVVSSLQKGTFKRYESINTSSETTEYKESAYSKVPEYVLGSPLGYGLGNSGSVGALGGDTNSDLLEGHGLTSETQYNVLVKELGAPGLLLWPLIVVFVSLLIVRRIRSIQDPDLAICLAGAFAAFAPLLIEGTSGFVSGSLAGGAYYWFVLGVASYWLVVRRPMMARPAQGRRDASPVPA